MRTKSSDSAASQGSLSPPNTNLTLVPTTGPLSGRDVLAAFFGFAILLLRAYKGLAEYIEDRLCQTEVIVLVMGPQAASEAVLGPAVLGFEGFP